MASNLGDGNYLAPEVEDTQVIEVGALNQSITFATLPDKGYGSGPFAVTATASSGLTVTFSTTTSSVCTVSAAGTVTIVAVGQCIVTANQAGNAQYAAASPESQAFTVAAVAPFAPTLTSASAGDGAITVGFVAPGFTGGVAITGYVARATSSAGSVSGPCADLTAPLVCTIAGLTNGTAYTVTIAAINSAGVGTASSSTGSLTPASAAMAVTNAYASPGDGTVDLYFDAITTGGLGGGTFTEYQIFRRVAGNAWPGTATTTVTPQGSGVLSQSYSGLANGTSYEFKIVVITTANTVAITGNTTIVTEYPSTVPTAPRDLLAVSASGTSMLITWAEPLSNGGAEITDYVVTLTRGASCGVVTIDPLTRVGSCTATGLAYSTTYTVTVAAENRMGEGAAETTTYTTGANPNTGGGGSGGGGTNPDDPNDPNGPGTDGDDDDPRRDGPGSNGPALPPRFPTPDGPGRDAERKLNGSPTTKDVKDIPTAGVLTGSGPVPATGWVRPTGVGPDNLYAVGNGVQALDPQSERVQQLQASGVNLTVIRSPGTEQFLTTWKFTVEPNSMLQVVMPVDPPTLNVPFSLWIQDRLGAWTTVGTTTVVDGQVVMPVLVFEKAGVYQVVATSIDSGTRVRAKDGTPTWGRTTIRTIVTVSAKDVLGTTLCPNKVGFGAESWALSKGDKQLLRRLATCLGATPKVTITGYVHAVTDPTVAKQVALKRATAVKKYLRDRGYTGRVILDQSIRTSPRECRPVEGRCAIVEIKVGDSRGRPTTAVQQAPAATPAPAPAPAQAPVDPAPIDQSPVDAGQIAAAVAPGTAASPGDAGAPSGVDPGAAGSSIPLTT